VDLGKNPEIGRIFRGQEVREAKSAELRGLLGKRQMTCIAI